MICETQNSMRRLLKSQAKTLLKKISKLIVYKIYINNVISKGALVSSLPQPLKEFCLFNKS